MAKPIISKNHQLSFMFFSQFQWLLSGGYIVYICGSALADDQMGPSQGVMYLTSRYNAKPIFCVTIGTLALIIGTAVCDWRILVLNRRIRDKKSVSFWGLEGILCIFGC
jgi:hypothetical protein